MFPHSPLCFTVMHGPGPGMNAAIAARSTLVDSREPRGSTEATSFATARLQTSGPGRSISTTRCQGGPSRRIRSLVSPTHLNTHIHLHTQARAHNRCEQRASSWRWPSQHRAEQPVCKRFRPSRRPRRPRFELGAKLVQSHRPKLPERPRERAALPGLTVGREVPRAPQHHHGHTVCTRVRQPSPLPTHAAQLVLVAVMSLSLHQIPCQALRRFLLVALLEPL